MEEVLERIRTALAEDRFEITGHFQQRLAQRGILWADILSIFEEPSEMEDLGVDDHGWPKCRVSGRAADGLPAAVVAAVDDEGRVRFITIHWRD